MMRLICIQAFVEGHSVLPWTLIVIENKISFDVYAVCRAPSKEHHCTCITLYVKRTAHPHVNRENADAKL